MITQIFSWCLMCFHSQYCYLVNFKCSSRATLRFACAVCDPRAGRCTGLLYQNMVVKNFDVRKLQIKPYNINQRANWIKNITVCDVIYGRPIFLPLTKSIHHFVLFLRTLNFLPRFYFPSFFSLRCCRSRFNYH